ncbi:hypothetical protein [Neptunomonas qingdaonensis]|uniref:Uncharacterized protein n=1 Tax=Neptunomonas qingdaonensis TaxID=1045558 RepID=A0A1I2N4P9_9GAMM|nr:hypothetical protein [Neptunomonas qingdaonensis]SFF97819.1 hypothetical protein SAMN05216175_102246 [Neptunomonas qingdaonensis]
MKKELTATPTAVTNNKAKPLPKQTIVLKYLITRSLVQLEALSNVSLEIVKPLVKNHKEMKL